MINVWEPVVKWPQLAFGHLAITFSDEFLVSFLLARDQCALIRAGLIFPDFRRPRIGRKSMANEKSHNKYSSRIASAS